MQLAKGKARTTIAFVRAGDHPILHGLTSDDMRWWQGLGDDEHYVADGTYLKPSKGQCLPLVDIGSGDGLTQAPMVEIYDGKGSYVLCQMLVVPKAGIAPQARVMLENMLAYLASPNCFRTGGRTIVFASPTSPLRAALAEVRLETKELGEDLDSLTVANYDVAIVDAATGLTEDNLPALQAFVRSGGRVLVHRVTPQTQALVEKLLGGGVRLTPVEKEPQDVQNHVLRMTDSGLLSGISNHELWWMSPKYLAIIHQEGNWCSGYSGGCPPEERIADYYCWPASDQTAKIFRLTRPGTLLQAPVGEGFVAVSQLRIDQHIPEIAPLAQRFTSELLTNLGCTLKGDADIAQARQRRLEQYSFTTIDLSAYANRGRKDDKAAGIVGWANQGENDVRDLPVGRQVLAGVPFQIASPKAAVVLYSQSANNTDLPKAVKGIKIGQKADAIFFMHACAYGSKGCAFKYVVHYEDGGTEEVPIGIGKQVYDWWSDPTTLTDTMAQYNGFVAWKGSNPMTQKMHFWGIMVPGWEWTNPHPEKAVRDIDFVTDPESDFGRCRCWRALPWRRCRATRAS